MRIRQYTDYLLDALFGVSRFTPGLFKPSVVRGRFDHAYGEVHDKIFKALRKHGFKTTRWQLIFPGQTAGLVKQLDHEESPNEIHVRFFADGTIHSEREHGRFDLKHWSGERFTDFTEIVKVIEREFDETYVHRVRSFFKDPQFSKLCIRKRKNG